MSVVVTTERDTSPVRSFFGDPGAAMPSRPRSPGVVAFVGRDDRVVPERRADFVARNRIDAHLAGRVRRVGA